jgi:hypothetical protein
MFNVLSIQSEEVERLSSIPQIACNDIKESLPGQWHWALPRQLHPDLSWEGTSHLPLALKNSRVNIHAAEANGLQAPNQVLHNKQALRYLHG